MQLIKCFECGRILQGSIDGDKKKQEKYEMCSRCIDKHETVKRENERGGRDNG